MTGLRTFKCLKLLTVLLLQDTIVGVEEAAKQLPKDNATDLRTRVCGIFRSSKLPEENITKEQILVVKVLEGRGDPACGQGERYCSHEEE